MSISEFSASLFYLQKCLRCGNPTEGAHEIICPDCLAVEYKLLRFDCEHCGNSISECACSAVGKRIFYLYEYHSRQIRGMISKFKHRADKNAANYLTGLLAERMTEIKDADAIIFAPRSKKSLSLYGFDQSKLLAAALGKHLGLPVIAAIYRKYESKPQKLLSFAQRRDNMANIFGVREVLLDGIKHVILIDDVVTTGATMWACDKVLRDCGVTRVYKCCIAKSRDKLI